MAKQAQAVRMQWVPSEFNRADILTKALSAKAFSRLRDVIMNVGKMAVRLCITSGDQEDLNSHRSRGSLRHGKLLRACLT